MLHQMLIGIKHRRTPNENVRVIQKVEYRASNKMETQQREKLSHFNGIEQSAPQC